MTFKGIYSFVMAKLLLFPRFISNDSFIGF